MSAVLDFFGGTIGVVGASSIMDELQLMGLANCGPTVSAQLAQADANIEDVSRNWNPGDLFRVDQMQQINEFALDVLQRASAGVEAAMKESQLPRARELLIDALDEGTRHSLVDPMPYVNAVRSASQSGIKVIESKGYKRWIINVLRAARKAQYAVLVVECSRPNTMLAIYDGIVGAVSTLVNFIKQVLVVTKEVIAALGGAILKIPDVMGSFLTVMKLVPWVALAFGGYYAAIKLGRVPPKYDPLKLRERETWRPWRKATPSEFSGYRRKRQRRLSA